MKAVLAGTSVLVLLSSVAAAEVAITGEARMGLIDTFGDTGPLFTSRVRIAFAASGETDTGASFGAAIRNDNGGEGVLGTAGSVFVSGGFGKLSMGDVDSAAQAAIGNVDGVGLTGLGDLNESVFVATGGGDGKFEDYQHFSVYDRKITGDPSILYEFSTSNLVLTASATQLEYSYRDGFNDLWFGEAYAFGAAYTIGSYKVAAGYERLKDVLPGSNSNRTDNLLLGADATFGALTVKARLGRGASDYAASAGDYQDNDQWALSATYVASALELTAFVSDLHYTRSLTGTNRYDRRVIGLGASYDLGGGAMVKSGIVRRTAAEAAATPVEETAIDIGLGFSF